MIVRLNKPELKETYSIISSKSICHRALICAAFSDAPTLIDMSGYGEDVLMTIDCLRRLGANITERSGSVRVEPIDRRSLKNSPRLKLNCGESGTTYRFLKEITEELGLEAELEGSDRLIERVTSSVPTSQSISGRMLALGLRGEGVEVEADYNTVSRPYIELTASVMCDFGCSGYKSPAKYSVEGDWSLAANFMVAAAISARTPIKIKNLYRKSAQGDSNVADILREFGARVFFEENDVYVSGAEPRGRRIDGSMNPDLVPLLSVLASFSEGETVIENISYLRYKESDRLISTSSMIKALGGEATVGDDFLKIKGKNETGGLRGGRVIASNDHRIAMAAAAASFGIDGTVEIDGAECVKKSYPDFWEEII